MKDDTKNNNIEKVNQNEIKDSNTINEQSTDNKEFVSEKHDQGDKISENKDSIRLNKRSSNILTSTLAIILIIFLFATASVSSYMPIRNRILNTDKNVENYIQSNELVYRLSSLTEYLYKTRIQDVEWYSHRDENINSIKYYITNSDNSININNIPELTNKKLEKEIENSQFYLKAKLYKDGKVDVSTSLEGQFNTVLFINNLNLEEWEDVQSDEEYPENMKGTRESTDSTDEEVAKDKTKKELEELEITYIIPKDLESYNDSFVKDMKYHYTTSEYLMLILIIGAVSILLLIIIGLSIPYSYQERAIISRLYNKMFLELKGLLCFVLLFFFLCGINIFIPYYDNAVLDIINIIYEGDITFYLIGIPLTFSLYLLIYLNLIYMKYIYFTGFKKGFIENSFMGRIGFSILRRLKRALVKLMTLNISKDPNRSIFILLAVNLFILWIIAISGGVGFILATIWAVFIFKYLVNFMLQIKDIYSASSQLSKGDFNINLDEDTGMLTPISKNLNNIKEGFKLAVDKEIKSERMKSELISNVSHDLKTPLTSIITYVDLLKDENITRDDQRKYIDILDRKSKRLNILIEDLFEASKAGSGNIELSLEEIDIIALFRQTLGEMEEKINNSNLIMRVNIPDDKVICKLDGRRTYRIFENIMENVLKYTMANTRVYIDVIEEDREVQFIFKNISSYEMNFDAKEITERFTRGDESRNTEGSGLGLSIAKSLVELQDGRMNISIDGDLFKLTLTFLKYKSN